MCCKRNIGNLKIIYSVRVDIGKYTQQHSGSIQYVTTGEMVGLNVEKAAIANVFAATPCLRTTANDASVRKVH